MYQQKEKLIIEQLSRSKIYRDYENAFNQATGLPLKLRITNALQLVQHGDKYENPFCGIFARHNRTCAACLQVQQKVVESSGAESKTVTCFAGLCDTAVPVKVGEKLVGYLQTGQVLLKQPTQRQFARTTRQLLAWGLKVDFKQLRDAYFQTRVLTPKQYNSILKLLTIFGQHLSCLCHQVLIQPKPSEPMAIQRARQFIQDHQSDKLSLTVVAKAVNTKSIYFCKLFKRTTGVNFTEYLTRVRVDSAKNIMSNPNLRISEVAYQVGFQSITHFNRVFKDITGLTPTGYRSKLPSYKSL